MIKFDEKKIMSNSISLIYYSMIIFQLQINHIQLSHRYENEILLIVSKFLEL